MLCTPLLAATLLRLVQLYGPSNWTQISEHMTGRSGMHCRQRWITQVCIRGASAWQTFHTRISTRAGHVQRFPFVFALLIFFLCG
jgi:hypothetical protein